MPAKPFTIEVVFTPLLFPVKVTSDPCIVVLADILRATTSICAAFDYGVERIIPVSTTEEARRMKEKGYLVASEQDGIKHDFADFGNSAFHFSRESIGGKTLVYCTTNGTRALKMSGHQGRTAIGAFINISVLSDWLLGQNMNVVILCSGWKNMFCLEDSLFAGALTEKLLAGSLFTTRCDSAFAALDLWNFARYDLIGYLEKAAHRERLKNLNLDDVIPFSFTADSSASIPVFENGEIRNVAPVVQSESIKNQSI